VQGILGQHKVYREELVLSSFAAFVGHYGCRFLWLRPLWVSMVLPCSLDLRLIARVTVSWEGVSCQPPHCAFNITERHQE